PQVNAGDVIAILDLLFHMRDELLRDLSEMDHLRAFPGRPVVHRIVKGEVENLTQTDQAELIRPLPLALLDIFTLHREHLDVFRRPLLASAVALVPPPNDLKLHCITPLCRPSRPQFVVAPPALPLLNHPSLDEKSSNVGYDALAQVSVSLGHILRRFHTPVPIPARAGGDP